MPFFADDLVLYVIAPISTHFCSQLTYRSLRLSTPVDFPAPVRVLRPDLCQKTLSPRAFVEFPLLQREREDELTLRPLPLYCESCKVKHCMTPWWLTVPPRRPPSFLLPTCSELRLIHPIGLNRRLRRSGVDARKRSKTFEKCLSSIHGRGLSFSALSVGKCFQSCAATFTA